MRGAKNAKLVRGPRVELKPVDVKALRALDTTRTGQIAISTMELGNQVKPSEVSVTNPIAGLVPSDSYRDEVAAKFIEASSYRSNSPGSSLWSWVKRGAGKISRYLIPITATATGLSVLVASGGDITVVKTVFLSGLMVLGIAAPVMAPGLGFGGLCMRASLYGVLDGFRTRFTVEVPDAATGLEGMKKAHEILKKRGAVGILIGGMAEAVWNREGTPENLSAKKDINVLVVSDGFEPKQNFEGGIDWWLPRSDTYEGPGWFRNHVEVHDRWWINGQGEVLSFGVEQKHDLPPGLYIPSSEWVIDMRRTEGEAQKDGGLEIYDRGVAFERKMRREGISYNLVPAVRDDFGGFILDEKHESDGEKVKAFKIYEVDMEQQRAIHDNILRTPANP